MKVYGDMKTFVIGDIHGAAKALSQCIERSGIDPKRDRLICLGDIVDGFPETKECVEQLLSFEYCHLVLGNHDHWALEYYNARPLSLPCDDWYKQGGKATIESYGDQMPQEHLDFMNKWYPFVLWDDTVFVHGGFNHQKSLEDQNLDDLMWNRQMIETAWKKKVRNQQFKFGPYDEIFVGHTTTQAFGIWNGERIIQKRPTVPLHMCNVWAMDTGAGWDGKLTIMDVKTKVYWQSDNVLDLYPNMGRGLRF